MIVKKRDENNNPLPDPDAWDGFCIELIKHIAHEVNFSFTIHEVRDKTYGKYNGTGPDGTPTWDGMIGELMDNVSDARCGSPPRKQLFLHLCSSFCSSAALFAPCRRPTWRWLRSPSLTTGRR